MQESWWSFQAAFYRCAIVETNCAKNSVCISLIDPPMQVYGFYNSSPASWTMSGTPLLSGTIATCSCAKKKHFEVWPALTIWRQRGIGPRWWNKCRYTFGCTSILWLVLHLLEMKFIWTSVWQCSLLWMGRVDLFLLFKEDFLAFIRSTLALIRRTLALTRTTFSSMSAPDIVSAAHYVWQAYNRQPT